MFKQQSDVKLASLLLPMRSLGANLVVMPDVVMGEGKTFGAGGFKSQSMSHAPRIECSIIDIGMVAILSGKTTPIHAWEQDNGRSSITMCYAGSPRYQDANDQLQAKSGDILVVPRNGGRISTGYLASINFPIEHQRLIRTVLAMQGEDDCLHLDRALIISGGVDNQQVAAKGALFQFFSFIDTLLREDRHLGTALGLDEQVYRLFAYALMRSSGILERVQRRWECAPKHWSNPLDDLVDYIRQNAHQGLTLTDLEEQSHYSSRHLQNLFREKFDCTPMQFVRRQRLAVAMEKLQRPEDDDTVTRIARACGYRFTSNFTSDFKREYGVNPSAVLRASQSMQS